ncbi:MAG: hypothetical protein MI975_02310 [Cytophagales bacterium]|nr:hypothetical protein [Cytophagales bacterium]
MSTFKALIIAICFLAISGSLYGQTCCSGGVPISGNLGMPYGSSGTWQFSLSYDINVLKTLKEGTEVLDDDARERITQSVLFQTGYSISKRFSADLLLSYVKQERTIRQFDNTDYVSTGGIGDAALLIKYTFSDPDRSKVLVTAAAGPKIPTGKTDFTRRDGIPLNADLQPGSGSWDGLFWINGLYKFNFRPNFNIASTVIYSLKGKNNKYLTDQTYQFGNELQVLVSLNDNFPVWKSILDATLFLRYRKALTDRFNDLNMPNTGGEWIFLAPSLGYNISQNLAFNAAFEVPLYANVTGTQLSPTYRLNVGVFVKFNRKNELLKL